MSLDTLVLVALVGSFFAFMAVEALVPARRAMPQIRYWRLIGIAGFAVSMAVNVLAPLAILPLFAGIHALDLSGWGGWAALPVIVLTTFFTYWSHRIQHRFDVLWRMGHQLHHGVARIDIASAFIFHPVDVFIQVFWTLLASVLLGVSPVAGAIAGVLGAWIAFYQHWNIDTPRWTNWIIQRPEAHMLHHEYNVHARNFGDMPVWDMLFGTYVNPARADDIRVGFEPERMRRWLAMVAMIDVSSDLGRERL
ncbi:sterol desaturase family protein [Novosphingobium sp. Gsoil 351]|uniref:sterol desaturase family protein n=1 Tax=Novosphingobium sp. Gsoil 351 TaxID=2675225 RepID=UPI0012B44A6B|nr:sterol desaturase family protein [Novosphingobium sp. Gsoil 351]QGN53732.1 fatty acid hydroxylase [Novosphingobium sp. Gsoil 351]